MIARADALAALDRDSFDIVVVGGGITGAGVAFDAATRGYSVALVERADFASGTSSRSSKLVHGGLRYLQNFDLGLVREALLERQLLVALAPHLVKPLPLVVPAFEGARLDRLIGVGLNLYDVMSVDKLRRRRGRGESNGESTSWSPDRHRIIPGDEVVELVPALAAREPTSGYLFYDCQTDDARLVLTVLAEAERFGAVCANGCEVTELVEEHGRACGVRVRDTLSDGEFVVRADTVVNATGVWADRLKPGELQDEAEVPRIRPSRGTHVTLNHASLPLVSGAIVPAGGRALDLRAAVARVDADRHHRQRLRRREPRPRQARRRGRQLPAGGRQRVLRHVAGAERPHRRLRRRPAADLDRRPEEVRRHLAQGRAVRDLERHGDDHRRQADDVPADGEDDRGCDRRARGP
jgi:glycerol-3-phosphate dehydrogenase